MNYTSASQRKSFQHACQSKCSSPSRHMPRTNYLLSGHLDTDQTARTTRGEYSYTIPPRLSMLDQRRVTMTTYSTHEASILHLSRQCAIGYHSTRPSTRPHFSRTSRQGETSSVRCKQVNSSHMRIGSMYIASIVEHNGTYHMFLARLHLDTIPPQDTPGHPRILNLTPRLQTSQ